MSSEDDPSHRSRRDRSPRSVRTAGAAVLAIVVVLSGSALLVHATGGTQGPYLHLAYLPIVCAAILAGPLAGALVGAAATLTVGPWMPLDVAAGVPQTTEGWLFRGVFFVAIGAIAGIAATVLRLQAERTRRLQVRLADTYGRNLRLFARLVEARDEQTRGHCDRVARNAVAIGHRLGLDETSLGRLFWAGQLHDLGKLEVPEAILRKPGSLTEEERREMERHSEAGRRILANAAPEFAPLAEGVVAHHERWDGTGYPAGLKGEAIPIYGRILAVADVYEAITSHRPYRSPMTHDDALAVLAEGRGSQFDPAVLDAFLAALRDGEIRHETDRSLEEAFALDRILTRPDQVGAELLFGTVRRARERRAA